MNTTELYNEILKKLRQKEPFAFSRFGDGEFKCIFGKKGANCDGHQYFPDLGRRLKRILEAKPSYIVGIQDLSKRLWATHEEFQRLTSFTSYPADAFHHANQHPGNLQKFFEILRSRKVILVGPKHLLSLSAFQFKFVAVPVKDCWLQQAEIENKIEKLIRTDMVVLFCASMMTKPVLHSLWGRNKSASFIDIGSAFDPHVGIHSRKYHKTLAL